MAMRSVVGNVIHLLLLSHGKSPLPGQNNAIFWRLCYLSSLKSNPRVNRILDAKSAVTLSLRQDWIGHQLEETLSRFNFPFFGPCLHSDFPSIRIDYTPPACARGCSILCTTFPMGQGHPNEIAGRAEETEISYWTYVSAIKRMAFQGLYKSPVTLRNQWFTNTHWH